MDVVYIVRPTGDHASLRYSLRSLANVSNFDSSRDRVWIVGTRPSWISSVEFVEGNQHGNDKGRNIFGNWLTFAELAHAPDRFIAFNDDIFATRRVAARADEWHELLADTISRPRTQGWWLRSLQATLAHCQQLTERPRSFELHRPVVLDRARLRTALAEVSVHGEPPQWRSVYGNRWHTGRRQVPDVKTRLRSSADLTTAARLEPWISTRADSWLGTTGQVIRSSFTTPSSFE
jgi:hypothetical protein